MLKFVIICGVAAVSAIGAAQAVVSLDHARSGSAEPASVAMAVTADRPAASQPETPATASIARSSDGHYWAEASVNGSAVKFLVDTGATAVALSPNDARRLGFNPSALPYTYKVMTAAGEARAAKVKLESVAIGSAKVEGVEAYVIEQGLTTSLLGMSYLGRLSEWKATPNSLILRA